MAAEASPCSLAQTAARKPAQTVDMQATSRDTGAVIQAEALSHRYGRTRAVDEVSLTVRRGEILALLGPNGAGKTTTLSMLTGNLAPSGGRIVIAGHDLLDDPRGAKRSLGYLPEHPPLYPEMLVDDYLAFCARLHGVPRRKVAAAVGEAATRCGIEGERGRLIGHLSKGYQQRIGIAQALVHHPEAVILDEPTVGLDPVQIRATRELITALAAEAAVIVSTHLLAEAAEIADRVAVLCHGRIVHESRPEAETERLRVELERPPEPARLARVPGVTAVETPAPGLFLLDFRPDDDPRTALMQAVVAEDWGLRTLVRERRSLEDVFMAAIVDAPETDA